jgi:hypothetical protein
MSGDGVISVRLQRSLLDVFRATAQRQGISLHEAARRLISGLPDFTSGELEQLPEPTREFETPRVSLYIGWRLIDVLISARRNTSLGDSNICRRLIYGLLVTNEIEFVQQNDRWKLQLAKSKSGEKAAFYSAEKGPQCA